MKWASVLAITMLMGCAAEPRVVTRTETVTVEVPVYRQRTPPAWLLDPVIDSESFGDVFVAPDDPDVVLGVTRDGLSRFWQLVDRPIDRIQEWRAWALPANE